MKELLITSGFPRSGSTYLNHALNLLYYPEQEANWNRHTVVAIEKSDKIMVTFRNPLDSISSWHRYPSGEQLDLDIKYYIRFYTAVLENLNKIVLMDFDLFTSNIEYIKDKVFKNFGIKTNNYVSDSMIKETMLKNGKDINLPTNNKDLLEPIKSKLKEMPEFYDCIEIYAKIKDISNIGLQSDIIQ